MGHKTCGDPTFVARRAQGVATAGRRSQQAGYRMTCPHITAESDVGGVVDVLDDLEELVYVVGHEDGVGALGCHADEG